MFSPYYGNMKIFSKQLIFFSIICISNMYLMYHFVKKIGKGEKLKSAIIIFVIALFWRCLFLNIFEYEPTNDFINYFNLGISFINGDKQFIRQVVSGYNIPYFGGLSFLYGCLYRIFGVSYHASGVAFSVISSLTCVVIYLIVSEYEEIHAILASTISAFYPAGLLISCKIKCQYS